MTDIALADDTSGESDVEQDEEPLFADDLEDLPPLPPPMPSLSQLQDEANAPSNDQPADNTASGQDNQTSTNQQGPPQKKRKPVLTLTMDRVFSDKGLPYVEAEFPKLKFKGQRHEASDLKYLLQQYEHWANMMYPKLTFKDVMLRIQRLSTTKEFKMQLTGMRRRHARGGVATPPLVDSDDEDDRHPEQQDLRNSTNSASDRTHMDGSDHTHMDVSDHTHMEVSDHTHMEVSDHTHMEVSDHASGNDHAASSHSDTSLSRSIDDRREGSTTPSAPNDQTSENLVSPLDGHTPSECSSHEEEDTSHLTADDLHFQPHDDHTPVTPSNHSIEKSDQEELDCSLPEPLTNSMNLDLSASVSD